MKDYRTEEATRNTNAAVLTNAVELGAQVVMAIAGNEIANTVEGKLVTPAFLQEAIVAKTRSILAPHVGDR